MERRKKAKACVLTSLLKSLRALFLYRLKSVEYVCMKHKTTRYAGEEIKIVQKKQ